MSSFSDQPKRWMGRNELDQVADLLQTISDEQENLSKQPTEPPERKKLCTVDLPNRSVNSSDLLLQGLSEEDLFVTIENEDCYPVTYMSTRLEELLGYNQMNIVIGQPFTGLLNYKDISVFTNVISLKCGEEDKEGSANGGSTFYCRLKKRKCISQHFGLMKTDTFWPFRAKCRHKKNVEIPSSSHLPSDAQTVVIIFQTLNPIFIYPDQAMTGVTYTLDYSWNFHVLTGTCDDEVIETLGYLPQDLRNTSGFLLIHPMDQAKLTDIYRSVLNGTGNAVKTPVYGMKAYNGSYLMVKSELTALEMHIHGVHHVIKGPPAINIFSEDQSDYSSVQKKPYLDASNMQSHPAMKKKVEDSWLFTTHMLEDEQIQMIYKELNNAYLMEKYLSSCNSEMNSIQQDSEELAGDLSVPMRIDIPVSVARQGSEQSSIKAQVSDVGQHDACELSQSERSDIEESTRNADYQPIKLSEHVLKEHLQAQTTLYVHRELEKKQYMNNKRIAQLLDKEKIKWSLCDHDENPQINGTNGTNSQSVMSRAQLQVKVSSMLLPSSSETNFVAPFFQNMQSPSNTLKSGQNYGKVNGTQKNGSRLLLWNSVMRKLHNQPSNQFQRNHTKHGGKCRHVPYFGLRTNHSQERRTNVSNKACMYTNSRIKSQIVRSEEDSVPWTITEDSSCVPGTNTTVIETEDSIIKSKDMSENIADKSSLLSHPGSDCSTDIVLESASSDHSNEPLNQKMMSYAVGPRVKMDVLRSDQKMLSGMEQHWKVLDQIEELLSMDNAKSKLEYDLTKLDVKRSMNKRNFSRCNSSSVSDDTLFRPVKNLINIPSIHMAHDNNHTLRINDSSSHMRKVDDNLYFDSPLSILYTDKTYSDTGSYISSIKESDDRSSSPVKMTSPSCVESCKVQDPSCLSGQSSGIPDETTDTDNNGVSKTSEQSSNSADLPNRTLICVSRGSHITSSGVGTSLADSNNGSFSSASEHRRAQMRLPNDNGN